MHRQLFAAALIAAFPMLAFAAGQSPAATEKPHPSSRAHANAVAGQANAARIEACGNLSTAMLGALDKGDFKAATSNYDVPMQAGLDAGKLATVWASIGAQFGKLESRGTPLTVMYQGMPVVTTHLRFAKGDLAAQVACDSEGKIAGFHLQPIAPASSR